MESLLKSILNFSKPIFLLLASAYFVYGFLMQVGVDQDYAPIQFTIHIEFTRAMGLAVNIVTLLQSKQAFWYSFIERLYELSQKFAEVSDTTATPEYSKAFMMQKSKVI
jgi:hypothetical protein